MKIITLVIAAYGGLLSTLLGYRAYRRDRHRVRLTFGLEIRMDEPHCLAIHAVNDGARPVTLTNSCFYYSEDTGTLGWTPLSLHESSSSLLPCKLDEGDLLTFRCVIDDVPSTASGFEVVDTHGHVYRKSFDADFRTQLKYFRLLLAQSTGSEA